MDLALKNGEGSAGVEELAEPIGQRGEQGPEAPRDIEKGEGIYQRAGQKWQRHV